MNYIALNTMRKVRNGFLLIMMCASLAGCGKSADLELKSIGEPGEGEEMLPEEDVSSKETEAEETETETETEPVLIRSLYAARSHRKVSMNCPKAPGSSMRSGQPAALPKMRTRPM